MKVMGDGRGQWLLATVVREGIVQVMGDIHGDGHEQWSRELVIGNRRG